MVASQAKRKYQAYWDEYFKFSVVRNPINRVTSCLKYAEHFYLKIKENGDLDFSEYHRIFGRDIVLEIDHRFYNRKDVELATHRGGCIYMNILDEPLDRIFKFEDFGGIEEELQEVLRIRDRLNHREEQSVHHHIPTEDTVRHVQQIYREDIRLFSYNL